MPKTDHIALLILDGWGHGQVPEADAIAQANTPFVDSLYQRYPHSELITYGEQVGLPDGQMGNSEVGHLNIGAGRIVYQELQRINHAIDEGSLAKENVLIEAINRAKPIGVSIHLLGLVSDGGVHSHINHLNALCQIIEEAGDIPTYIHAFTDGRDVDPESGLGHIENVINLTKGTHIQLATITGRYYAMDRDRRWERTKLAYDAIVHGLGQQSSDAIASMSTSYAQGVTDEFIKPVVMVGEDLCPIGQIKNGDVVIFFNFRTDRPRQLTEVLSQNDLPDFNMYKLDLHFVTMTAYNSSFDNLHVIFTKENLEMTLGQILSKRGLSQLRVAETEKYPHVTYFFSGGQEDPFEGEERLLVASPKVATYDLQPEMSAVEITKLTMEKISGMHPNFLCLNYANTDMVGHTGDFGAAMIAAETVDNCLKRLVPFLLNNKYEIIIIADHGNSDYMINEDGSPNTAHSKNPVPCIFVSKDESVSRIKNGKLADLATTILSRLGLDIPKAMQGQNLIQLS